MSDEEREGEESEEEPETVVVDKSRDGRNFFDAFRSLRKEVEEERKRARMTLRYSLTQNQNDEDTAPIVLACQEKVLDRLGVNYFAKLGENWDAISRADQFLPLEYKPVPPDPDAGNVAFTQLFDNPHELDLAAHPPKERLKMRPRLPRGERRSMEGFDIDDELIWGHFKAFVHAHDSNISQLRQLCESLLLSFVSSPLRWCNAEAHAH
jgi:hypothetical protein